jgi:hypothetical protein
MVTASRTVEVNMVKKRARWTTPNIELLLPDLQSPDEVGRRHTVRALCPCHAGWEAFEQHVGIVFRSLRDPSHIVRAHALHVLEDAARMMLAEDLRYHLEAGEEKLGEKRCRYRSMEQRLEARRNNRIRKLQRRRSGRTRPNKALELTAR